ncbi:MAG: hypothetical protein Q8O76_13060, partial [Chloroflexota bacterium]|nr:hypothetical protein [Chloroflexota bacterium]
IRYWEMWNEPDFPSDQWVGGFWDGSVADYYRLLKVGYIAVKAADPEAVVLMGGLMYWRLPGWFGQLLDLMRDDTLPISGYWPYFDVLPWHWYSTASDLYWKTRWARTQLSNRGLPLKPIWVNETNVPVWNDYPGDGNEGDYKATIEEGASFVIQAAAWAFAAGVERIFVHQLYDDGTHSSEAFGLVRNFPDAPVYRYDGTPRPSYTAYQVASNYLAELTSPQRTNHGNWEELSFSNGSGQRVRVVWATVGTAVAANVSASATQATRIGQDGTTSTIYPSGGSYGLTLPGATNYNNPGLCPPDPDKPCIAMIGGKPYILVEYSDHAPPTSRVETL